MAAVELTGQRELLRLATAGSVDDGKSTLIGRLLLDTGSLLADHIDDVSRGGALDLAAVTDGLRAERERASRSTSPTGSSRPSGDRSSSPTPRATSATPATCSPARRPPSRARSDRRPHGGRHPDPQACAHRCAAGDRAHRDVRQQDGSGELGPGAVRGDRRRGPRGGPAPRRARRDRDPDQRLARRQHRARLRPHAVLRRPDAARVPGAGRHPGRPRSVAAASSDPMGGPAGGRWLTALHGADRRRHARGRMLEVGDEVVVLAAGVSTTITELDTLDGGADAAVPPMSVTFGLADPLDVGRGICW